MDLRHREQGLGAHRFRYEEPPRKSSSGLLKFIVIAVLVIAAIGGAVWYFLSEDKVYDMKNLPVIEADKEPAKIMPENAGKVDVPHQDKLFYNQVSGKGKPTVERLLPPPEEPLEIGVEQPVAPVQNTPAVKPETSNEDVVEFKEIEHPKLDEEEAKPAEVKPEVKKEEPVKEEEPIKEPKEEVKKVKEELVKKSPAGKPQFGIQIASAVSLVNAKKEWSLITRKAPELFNNQKVLYPKVSRGEKKGFLFRVQIGEFADKAEAAALCKKMEAKKIKCRVVPYKK